MRRAKRRFHCVSPYSKITDSLLCAQKDLGGDLKPVQGRHDPVLEPFFFRSSSHGSAHDTADADFPHSRLRGSCAALCGLQAMARAPPVWPAGSSADLLHGSILHHRSWSALWNCGAEVRATGNGNADSAYRLACLSGGGAASPAKSDYPASHWAPRGRFGADGGAAISGHCDTRNIHHLWRLDH